MNIKVRATDFEITPAINDYIDKKLSHLDKFFTVEALCEVEIGKTTPHHRTGDVFRAEINMTVDGKQYFAVAEKDDLYAAIDVVKDEMERAIVAGKDKRMTLRKRGSSIIKKIIHRWRDM